VQKRSIIFGLGIVALVIGINMNVAKAVTPMPVLAAPNADQSSPVTQVHWVCGRERCHWKPDYKGRIVVHPWMKDWGPPSKPDCYYIKSRGSWALICP
jgi:hypothetical protein